MLNFMINRHVYFKRICHVLYKIPYLPVAGKTINSQPGSLGILLRTLVKQPWVFAHTGMANLVHHEGECKTCKLS